MRKITFLLLMAMPLTVMAAVDDVFTVDNLKYKVVTEDGEKNEVMVIRPDVELTGDVVIPASVANNEKTYSVAFIKGGEIAEGCAFREMTGITSVTIPSTVYSLQGVSTFFGCTGLRAVYNNGSMDQIEGWTFYGCSSLEYCAIPASVIKVGESAFENCNALKSLTILGSVSLDQHALKNCSVLKNIYYAGSSLTLIPTEDTWQIFESTDNPVFYTKASALDDIKAALNGKADWIKDQATADILFTPATDVFTFARDFDVDFAEASDLKVRYASDYSDSELVLTAVTSAKAGTGLLIKGEAGTAYTLRIAETTPEAVSNKLVGVVAPKVLPATDGDKTNFILKDGVFKKVSTANKEIAAGKAYLQLPTSSADEARDIIFTFDDETTGIGNLTPALSKGEGVVYDLMGRKVENAAKGLYIVKGKKVIVK
ncbi:leucine-rich repeat domain-containing protein [Xylanibacter brevis]|uniref:leucine-rich repeat domain-containing protein n=1 Tax=Xylanibacter brevis TaxID=83231 RepID=UPI00138E1CD0|nr:leucine-rich repeat domain-containing protein [Xylanibacter brevis]